MKVYTYILEFRQNSRALADIISTILLLLSFVFFCYTLYIIRVMTKQTIFLSVMTAGIVGWWIYCYWRQQQGKTAYYRIGLLMAAAGWAVMMSGWNWISILLLITALIEKQVKFPQEVAFDDNGIVMNTLPKKRYTWSAVKNVVWKDGILTIDLRNNKLIQRETSTEPAGNDEPEFNEFCRSQVARHSGTAAA